MGEWEGYFCNNNINNNMMNSHAIMMRELDKNENSVILKEAISKAAKSVEEKVYWFNTSEMEGDFLQQYWATHVTADDIMKKRIAQITQQKFNELFAEVDKGKVTPVNQLEVMHIGNLNLSVLAQQIPIIDHKYFSPNHPKTIETKAKLKEIKQDYIKFKQRIQEIKTKEKQKKREKELEQEEFRQSLEKEKKEKIKQHVMKTLEEKSLKKEERKNEQEKYKQFLKAYKSTKPLHVLMEQQFKEKIELPILEENRRKLEQYKQNKQKVKPSLEEINEHERNYLDMMSNRQSRIVVANQTIDVFKSKFYLEEQKKLREGEQGYETLFDQVEKKKRYSELVKQNFKPKVSIRLRQSINQSQMKTSTAREGLDRSSQIQKGKDYLQFMRSLQKNRKQHSSPSEKAEQEQNHRYINYLEGLKQSRQAHGTDSKMSHDWERDMKNKSLSQYQKFERILMKSKQLEQIAKRKQLFVNNNLYGKASELIDKKKEIDQTLISSIRAKVAVLKDAQQK